MSSEPVDDARRIFAGESKACQRPHDEQSDQDEVGGQARQGAEQRLAHHVQHAGEGIEDENGMVDPELRRFEHHRRQEEGDLDDAGDDLRNVAKTRREDGKEIADPGEIGENEEEAGNEQKQMPVERRATDHVDDRQNDEVMREDEEIAGDRAQQISEARQGHLPHDALILCEADATFVDRCRNKPPKH